MKSNKWAPVAIPILIIIGIGWLLTAQGVMPAVNWVWTTALAALGIVTFVVSGIDKASVVIGPVNLTAPADCNTTPGWVSPNTKRLFGKILSGQSRAI